MGNYPFAPSPVDGETILVAAPTGLTTFDTSAVAAAIGRLTAAGGNATVQFQDGTYQIDSNTLVIRSCANFAVKGTGATIITQAPNRAGLPKNTTGNIFTIADSHDFRITDLTLDGLRDTVAPLTALSASASSGQPSVTVAAGQGSRYVVGQPLAVFGGLGTADQNLSDGYQTQTGNGGKIIQSITPGGGSGGGDLITFTTNLANSYTLGIPGTALSDGFGPYAFNGAYLTPYQTAFGNAVAGRSLSGEDQQNALHLLSCQRFIVERVTARNMWESQIKCGSLSPATALTDGCNQGTIADCVVYHGYDQGVSIWVSTEITVKGCQSNVSGWAGISLSGYSSYCSVVGNQVFGSVYRVPGTLNAGSGIAVEGGSNNTITANQIDAVDYAAILLVQSSLVLGLTQGSQPTTSAFLVEGTAAGTSVQLSSTTLLTAGAVYSILDGVRTEQLTIATIVDGTHVTFVQPTRFSHAAGVFIVWAVAQENIVSANSIRFVSPTTGDGVHQTSTVRNVISGNVIQNPVPNQGSGIIAVAQNSFGLPAATFLGGDGSTIEGNTVNGGYKGIIGDSVTNLKIRGNRVFGMIGTGPSQPGIIINGLTDSEISGNHVTDIVNNAGIFVQVGQVIATTPARLTIRGNTVGRTNNEGIICLTGDSLMIENNSIHSCGGNAGINLRGVTNSLIANNVCNSNHNAGIQLEQQVATGCSNCRIIGNTCRDDGSGVNVATGAAWTQANGIVEVAPSNVNLFVGNEVDSNGTAQLTTVGAGTVTHYNIVSGAITA
jgi:hypothetical protein